MNRSHLLAASIGLVTDPDIPLGQRLMYQQPRRYFLWYGCFGAIATDGREHSVS
jgi:hypothetical protein